MKSMKVASASRAAPSRAVVAPRSVAASARAGNWLPGSEAPSWLPENLAGCVDGERGADRSPLLDVVHRLA